MRKDNLGRYVGGWQKEFDKVDGEAPYEWKVFGTLTVPAHFGFSQSRRTFHRWAAEMRKPVLPHFLNWFAVIEHSRWQDNIRIHVVMGGWKIRIQPSWTSRWKGISGGSSIFFDYHRGAFAVYVNKKAPPDRYFGVSMDLCGWGLNEIDCD
jgi:hypothetical protein